MTRRTKIKIRKAVAFTRNLFLVLFFIFVFLTICSVDSEQFVFPLVFFGVGTACFGISYGLDYLLFVTAWKGDKPSPFVR